ncbi:17197_t:CDS:2, partial [Funneliformis geosporum]
NNKDKYDNINTYSTNSDTEQLLILTNDDDPNTLNSKKINLTYRKKIRATRKLTKNTSTKQKSIFNMIYTSSNEPVDSIEEIDKYLELNKI